MIGNTYLAPRVEPRVPEDGDGLRGYLRTEFRGAGRWEPDASCMERESQVPINGGRNGRLAKARVAVGVAGVFLLSPFPRRRLAGRNAPQSPIEGPRH